MLIPEPSTLRTAHWSSPAARGREEGPWGYWLPYAWQATADAAGRRPFPRWDRRRFKADFEATLAFWEPLLHLAMYGLSWHNPVQGLTRWAESGRETSDPQLAIIERWWGQHLEDFLAWGIRGHHDGHLQWPVCDALNVPPPSPALRWTETPFTRQLVDRCGVDPIWRSTWGLGNDPLHLCAHAHTPINPSASGSGYIYQSGSRYAVLLLEDYLGWYAALHRHGAQLPRLPNDRSWRITVVCRPVGVLGTFRRSRETCRWFAGRHRWHLLGCVDANQ